MKLLVLALLLQLLLSSCAATGLRRHLMVTDGSHGSVVLGRFKTREECEEGRREEEQSGRQIGLVTETRCTTALGLNRRR